MNPSLDPGVRLSRTATLLSFATLVGALLPGFAAPHIGPADAPGGQVWRPPARYEAPPAAPGGTQPDRPVARAYRDDLTT